MGADTRRARIENLIELARMSKGWSQSQLADYMNRSPGRLCPASGNPKSDFIIKLAEVLGWTPGEVLEVIWSADGGSAAPAAGGNGRTYEQLFDEAIVALEAGQYHDLLRVARSIRDHAQTPDEIACGFNFEVGAWDGLGRYLNALEAAQKGLELANIDSRWRRRLQANLANALYTLWRLPGALGLADLLVRRYGEPETGDVEHREFSAFIHYLRGNTLRRLMRIELDDRLSHARQAEEDLERARLGYEALAGEMHSARYEGIARTCAAALLEVRVELGVTEGAEAVRVLSEQLDEVVEPRELACGDLLESYGWSCVFGSNIALSTLRGAPLQRSVDLFVQKALEIADVLDNWALRERAITLQYELHRMLVEPTGLRFDFVVEEETRNLVAQTMGRFPAFRPVGWRILNSASVARKN